jgi:hypothetical protein
MAVISINNHLDAGYPLIAVSCADDRVVIESINGDRDVAVFSARGAIVTRDGQTIQDQTGWSEAFEWAASGSDRVLVVRDCQHVISNAPIYRALLELMSPMKALGSAVVLVAPNWELPLEMQHECSVMQWPLPSRDELRKPLAVVAESGAIDSQSVDFEPLLDAAAGMTLEQTENAAALSVVERDCLDADVITREKMRAIGSTGYLSVTQPVPMELIGGLGRFKEFMQQVKDVSRDPQLAVRGVILAGTPGTGKSLVSKAAGSVLGWPVLRLDVAACKGSLLGQSEGNIRHATRLAEAIAPCVVFIDEIEKAIGGYRSSGQTDGGTTLGMLGHLLTWLQEHESFIFVIATCNDYQSLPTALTRAGRFEQPGFVVDLPTLGERVAIAEIHLARLGCLYGPAQVAHVAEISDRWTGAEIEQLIKSAARSGRREITIEALDQAAVNIKPLCQTRATEVMEFRDWAKQNLRLANDHEESRLGRRIRGSVSASESN